MVKKKKVIAILIAYNAEGTLKEFYKSLPKHLFDEILLFDDASQDDTSKISQSLGILTYKNKFNLGYGGNLKKALVTALSKGADIIVDIHPDNEYKSTAIAGALEEVQKGSELVVGNRFSSLSYIAQKSGMFIWKIIPILLLNTISGFFLKININDFHQGFRVYTKSLLKKINFEENSNNYIFSFELITQAQMVNAVISEVPVETSYVGKKRGAGFTSSVNYTLSTFKVIFMYLTAGLGAKYKIFKRPDQNLNHRITKLTKQYNL
ncbi:MAG: glycosyltransferase family 2 protein [Candidatus Curtissbacteria bacterium]|nr:glycosyltransferase family 2 protein [Candidatus Curtissbacteria bacterium]